MYFAKDKVIYKSFEHLTIFPFDTTDVQRYHLLKTKVPVYLVHDKKIETQKTARVKEEFLLGEKYPYTKFQELYAELFFRHLSLLYERVKVFYCRQHQIEIVNYITLENGMLLEAPEGYVFTRFRSMVNKLENIEIDVTNKWLFS